MRSGHLWLVAAAVSDRQAKGKAPFLLGGECAQMSSGCSYISDSGKEDDFARQTQLAAAGAAMPWK